MKHNHPKGVNTGQLANWIQSRGGLWLQTWLRTSVKVKPLPVFLYLSHCSPPGTDDVTNKGSRMVVRSTDQAILQSFMHLEAWLAFHRSQVPTYHIGHTVDIERWSRSRSVQGLWLTDMQPHASQRSRAV
jgi:hypothetical protein